MTVNTILQAGLWGQVPSEDTGEPAGYFTWRGCELCAERTGKRLGNHVYEVHAYASTDAADEDVYEFEICGGCINALANGEPWPEELDY